MKVTRDGGDTWSSFGPKIALQGRVRQLEFVNADAGWLISENAAGNLYLNGTSDGGRTWLQLSP